MVGYEKIRAELDEAGVSVFAAAVDGPEHTRAVQEGLGFPIAGGVTREQADALGAWWDDKRGFIQPSEFLVNRKGVVLSATYSTGPVGRLDASDALALAKILAARAKG